MSGYTLEALLVLRRREEKAAATQLADATLIRATAEEQDARWVAAIAAAEARLNLAVLPGDVPEPSVERRGAGLSAALVAAQSLFVERLRVEMAQERRAFADFRQGQLATARAQESAARKQHLLTRAAREAVEKHAEKYAAAQRASVLRREEDAANDIVHAARHPQHHQRHSGGHTRDK